MMKIGITGGIGSGKSTVCRLFAQKGVAVYDSDAAAKRLMQQDDALRVRLTGRFGAGTFREGQLDRGYLAGVVFSDPQALADGIVEELADATLRPLMVSAIGMIGFVLLFSILSIIANILLSTLGIVNHLPVVGPINALLGGAVGVLEGVLLVWVFAFLLRGLLGIYPEGWWIFRADTIGHTFLFRYFADPTLLGQLA